SGRPPVPILVIRPSSVPYVYVRNDYSAKQCRALVMSRMSTVPPLQRGTASGINTMVGNTGQMLSIAIAFPLVLSRIPEDVMFKVFLYGGGMGDVPEALHAFEQGLHQAFLVSFGITLVAALASALRPSHSPREVAAQAS